MRTEYDARISITGSGEPLVLVPGMDGTGQLFYRQLPLLSPRYRVATFALRNDAAEMTALVEDLSHVIAAVAPESGRAIVVGESFGGALALSFTLAHPEQVTRLVILNSFPYFAPQWRLRLAIGGLRLVPWGAMGLVRRLTASRLHSRHTHRDEIARFLELTAATSRAGYLNRLALLRGYDVRHRLAEIAVPVLFLAADKDHLVPAVAQARMMASNAPNATLQILEGHGHICLIAPDLDLGVILDTWRSRLADAG